MIINTTQILLPLLLQNQLVKYFEAKNAISVTSAIVPDEQWLRKNTLHDFKKLPFIKYAGNGKYYFDKNAYIEFSHKDLRKGLFLAGALLIIGTIIFFYFVR